MNISLLDCTLRDGGYYNNWDFPEEIVEQYLKAMADSGIEFVELGLRNFTKTGFLGAYAYTTEVHLNSLELPRGPKYGVMVDAKTILQSGLEIKEAVNRLFVPCSQSKLELVRVAAHFHEVEDSGPIVATLKELGYTVGFNLMQAGGKSDDEISSKASIANSWGNNLDVLYFADSLGNMDSNEVIRITKALRAEWKGVLGIHTHDNMGKGLDNSFTANSNGVEWLDVTVTGMGRGAGNTQTEKLLATLAKITDKYTEQPVYDLVIRYFEKMQKDFGWGTNLLYFLGAQNEIHPTYIQNLLSSDQYGTEEIVAAISYLSKLDGTTSYNGAILETAVNFNSGTDEVSGSTGLVGLFKDKNLLVVANGKTTNKYKQAVEQYIKEKRPTVISVNINENIDQSLIDFYVISHNVKFLTDASKYQSLKKPIILPYHRFSEDELGQLDAIDVIDFGFKNQSDELQVFNEYVDYKHDYTSAYLLGVILVSEPSIVEFVGFDGYDINDTRQADMVSLFSQYNRILHAPKLTCLTPTSYPINKGSIYAIGD